jgi:hypothetical protein
MLLTGVDNHRNGVGNLRETMPQAHLGRPGYQGSLTPQRRHGGQPAAGGRLPDHDRRQMERGLRALQPAEPARLRPVHHQGDTGSDNWDPAQRYLPHSAKVHWFENGKPAVMPKPSSTRRPISSTAPSTTCAAAGPAASPSSPTSVSRPTMCRCRRRASSSTNTAAATRTAGRHCAAAARPCRRAGPDPEGHAAGHDVHHPVTGIA